MIAVRGGCAAQDVPRCVPAKLQRTEQMGWIDTGMTSLRPNCLATHSLQEHVCGVWPRQGLAHVRGLPSRHRLLPLHRGSVQGAPTRYFAQSGSPAAGFLTAGAHAHSHCFLGPLAKARSALLLVGRRCCAALAVCAPSAVPSQPPPAFLCNCLFAGVCAAEPEDAAAQPAVGHHAEEVAQGAGWVLRWRGVE